MEWMTPARMSVSARRGLVDAAFHAARLGVGVLKGQGIAYLLTEFEQ
jgi:hypothetical protein